MVSDKKVESSIMSCGSFYRYLLPEALSVCLSRHAEGIHDCMGRDLRAML